MINNIVIVGRLTKDPKIYEKEGNKLATMCVAITRNYRDKDQNTICDFLYCKAVDKIANNIELYLTKGSLVGITGQMQSRKYEKEGQMHYVSELFIETIKFMSPRNKDEVSEFHETSPIDQVCNSIKDKSLQDNEIYEIV